MKSSTLKVLGFVLDILYYFNHVCYYFMMIIIVVVVCIFFFNQTGTSLILKTLWLYSCYFSIHSHCNTGSMEVAQREFGKSIIWENDSEFPKIWTIKLKHCISQQTKDIFLIWHYDIESIHLHFPLSRIFFRANLTSLFRRL